MSSTALPLPLSPPLSSNQIRRKLAASLRGHDVQSTEMSEELLRCGVQELKRLERGTLEVLAAMATPSNVTTASVTSGDPVDAGVLFAAVARSGKGLRKADVVRFTSGTGKDVDSPVLLNGALEMLVAALVVLPREDVEGAVRCVG